MTQNIHPALTPERQSFRERFNVRLVTDAEEGTSIVHLAEGVYGFTGAPATEEVPLFTKPYFECFEVLKAAGGDVVWIGYVTEKEYAAFQSGAEPTVIDLYPEPHGESTKLVAVPSPRVDRRRPPTREEGNSMRMEIGPKPEFLGMVSTQN